MSHGAKIILVIVQVLTIINAIVVAVHPNIVHAAAALFMTLIGVAILFLYAGSDFIAGVQIIVYAGGVTILVLFAVMLTRWLYKVSLRDTSAKYWVPVLVSIAAFLVVYRALLELGTWITDNPPPGLTTFMAAPKTEMIGRALVSDYVLVFEAVTVLLLGALVGAVWLARAKQ